jgi:glycosyltransferase involved in cell wall biosynthesis
MQKTKKFKLFIFHPYPKFGGADRSIIRLINSLKFNDITVISLTKCNYGKYLNKKIHFKRLDCKRVFFSIIKLRKFIVREISNDNTKKNLIISNQNFANIATIISLRFVKNIKKILIERNHFDELRYYRNITDFLKKKIILFCVILLYKKSDAVIGISKKLSSDLSKLINKKVHTIYNPAIDRSLFKEKKIKIPKKFLKKNKNDFILLNVGFFELQKDQLTILKALKIVKRKHSNFHLILIGSGSMKRMLEKYISTNGLNKDVTIFENITDAKPFYKIADLFILSSVYEGFANVVAEALFYNCPVITSNCNAGPMEIIENGKFGDFFPKSNFEILSKKIINFIKDPKKLNNKVNKSKNSLKKFTLQKSEANYKKLFEKI